MRKIAAKKLQPYRHRLLKIIRDNPELTMITDANGHEIALNLTKRFLLNKPYKNLYYQAELERHNRQLHNLIRGNDESTQ